MIPRVTLIQAPESIVELEPPAKKMCTPAIAGPSNSEQPVSPDPPKMKTPTKRKYSWKRANPDEEELIIAKCAAVMYRRTQHVKETIYEEGVKEGVWTSSDQTFLRCFNGGLF